MSESRENCFQTAVVTSIRNVLCNSLLCAKTLFKATVLLVTLIPLVTSVAFAAPGSPAADKDKPDFVVTQKSTRLGDTYLYISPLGFQMTNPNSGFTMSSRAPDWQIFMYNKHSQLYYQSSIEAWGRDTLIETGYDEWGPGAKWVKKGVEKICGYKGTVYTINGQMHTHQANGTVVVQKETVGAIYTLAEGYVINPKLAKLMNVVFNLPLNPGIPLRLVYVSDTGAKRSVLDTYRVDRCKLSVENFNLPVGYRLAHSRAEVMVDPQQMQMLQKFASAADMRDPKAVEAMRAMLNKNAYSKRVDPSKQGGAQTLSPEMMQRLMDMYKQQHGTK